MIELEGLFIFAQWAHRFNFEFGEVYLSRVHGRLYRLIRPWYQDLYEQWLEEQELRRFYEAWCDVLDGVTFVDEYYGASSTPFERFVKQTMIDDECKSCLDARMDRMKDGWEDYGDGDYIPRLVLRHYPPCTCVPNYYAFNSWVVSYAEEQGYAWWWDGYRLKVDYEPDVDGYELDEAEEWELENIY